MTENFNDFDPEVWDAAKQFENIGQQLDDKKIIYYNLWCATNAYRVRSVDEFIRCVTIIEVISKKHFDMTYRSDLKTLDEWKNKELFKFPPKQRIRFEASIEEKYNVKKLARLVELLSRKSILKDEDIIVGDTFGDEETEQPVEEIDQSQEQITDVEEFDCDEEEPQSKD